MGRCLGKVAHELDRFRQLDSRRELIYGQLSSGFGLDGFDLLSLKEVEAITALIQTNNLQQAAQSCGVVSDTMKDRASSIREKLGLETTRQLRALCAEWRR
ncbi:MAG: hypothetical protein ACSHYA_03125 [Opitutaceae bacterium]